ncbi:MAG: GTPase HflX [Oscillospiraceae bacterium]|jgi:GTP-binding protein HflX|nr:GTPase HflX [Oscillospiraceae bacterium]
MVHGNIQGIRQSALAELDALYTLRVEEDVFVLPDMLAVLARVSCAVNREISIYIARDGQVLDVTVGDLESVPLADMRQRRNEARLSLVRCVHTHPGGSALLSDVDINALKTLRLDAMAAVSVSDGRPNQAQVAFLGERVAGVPQAMLWPVVGAADIPQAAWMREILASDARVLAGEGAPDETAPCRQAILVGTDSEESLQELASLADTAGIAVIGRTLQRRTKPDNATYVGSGKARELALDCQGLGADTVIFDTELTGAQTRNLEDLLGGGVEVVDRTVLILAIFAQRAQSSEGRLQVELAQLSYQLPRLAGQGVGMSRLGAGAGLRSRGPGETKLELDRRRIRRRIADLNAQLAELEKQRGVRRARRQRNAVPVVALVGYTNAGKSTLLNRVSGADVLAEDKLFATLDPVTRSVRLPQGRACLLVDTVGFIDKLPHALVKAFRSTLEEAMLADLLVVVSDAASPHCEAQHQVVQHVLCELGAGDKPRIEALNKTDLAPDAQAALGWQGAIPISAESGTGVDALLCAVADRLQNLRRPVALHIPYAQGALLAQLHREGLVQSEAHEAEGTRVVALVDETDLGRLLRRGAALVPEDPA